MDLMESRRRLMEVMVAGGFKKLYSTEITATVTSTSNVDVTQLQFGDDLLTTDKMILITLRDKAGKRTGYFYGTDSLFIYDKNYKSASSASTVKNTFIYYEKNGYILGRSDLYGIFPNRIENTGLTNFRGRYSSTYGTIDGTFKVDVYAIDWPNGTYPFI